MPVVPCEATSNRAWAFRRTKESHLRPVGFICYSKGAPIDFVNGLIRVPGGVYLMRRHSRMPAAPNRQRVVGGSTTVGCTIMGKGNKQRGNR